MEYNIRKYGPGDRGAVRGICADTAVSGEPVELCFDDREIAADILVSYYTDFEPESCFVASDSSGAVIGYAAGCVSARRRRSKMLLCILPRALVKGVSRRLFLRRKALILAFKAVKAFSRGEFFRPGFSRSYPASLHVNVAAGCRGSGSGSALLRECLEHLGAEGARGVMLSTKSRAAAGFFARSGFDVLYERGISYLPPAGGGKLFIMGRTLRPGR